MSDKIEPLKYSMIIEWSDEDGAFLVTLPEWEGRVFNPVTHGESYEEAVQNGQVALKDLVALSRQNAEILPEPRMRPAAA